MAEQDLLRILLLVSMATGPLGTHRHFSTDAQRWPRRWGAVAHVCALGCTAVGLFAPAPLLCVAWLVFCAGSFGRFLWSRRASLGSLPVLAACVPFLFSNVAAVWLVAGTNDLRLLGYDTLFSFYAALHGNVLGWIMIGALAILVDRREPPHGVFLGAVFVCLASFLLVAFGIDQLRWLKPIGVIGLSVALPLSQLAFLPRAWGRGGTAFALCVVSFVGLAFTLVIAWGNELGVRLLPDFLGTRAIVSVHGILNAVVVGPCFLAAVSIGRPAAASTTR